MCEKEITGLFKKFCSCAKNSYSKMETDEPLNSNKNGENVGRITIVNEDDHSILFELCDDKSYSKKQWVQPNDEMSVEFDIHESLIWSCKAWFNGVQAEPITFNAWEGQNIKLMIRKDDGIYKARLDGTNEEIHVKFCIR